MGALVGGWAYRTRLRNQDWASERSLFLSAFKVCPNSVKVLENLGILYRRTHELETSVALFERAKIIARGDPDFCGVHYWLGLTQLNLGELDQVHAYITIFVVFTNHSHQLFTLIIQSFHSFRHALKCRFFSRGRRCCGRTLQRGKQRINCNAASGANVPFCFVLRMCSYRICNLGTAPSLDYGARCWKPPDKPMSLACSTFKAVSNYLYLFTFVFVWFSFLIRISATGLDLAKQEDYAGAYRSLTKAMQIDSPVYLNAATLATMFPKLSLKVSPRHPPRPEPTQSGEQNHDCTLMYWLGRTCMMLQPPMPKGIQECTREGSLLLRQLLLEQGKLMESKSQVMMI